MDGWDFATSEKQRQESRECCSIIGINVDARQSGRSLRASLRYLTGAPKEAQAHLKTQMSYAKLSDIYSKGIPNLSLHAPHPSLQSDTLTEPRL